jgi:CRP-like cAMP-binding protein
MYFIREGHAIMTWDQYEGVPVGVYGSGSTFGELEVYKNTRRLFSCWAVTDLDLFVLSKKDFKRIFFQNFPDFGQKHLVIMDRAFDGLEGIMQMVVDFLIIENSSILENSFHLYSPNSSKQIDTPKSIDYLKKYKKSFTSI